MKIPVWRGANRAASLAMLALAVAAPSRAQAPAHAIKDQLVGNWQLAAITVNDTTPYGAAPQGSMFFDAAGHYSVIVISAGTARSIAYFGTYTIDEPTNAVTFHIDGSNIRRAVGRNEKRTVSITGDQLTVENQGSANPALPGGAIKMTWKRPSA